MLNCYSQGPMCGSNTVILQQLEEVRDQVLGQLNYELTINRMLLSSSNQNEHHVNVEQNCVAEDEPNEESEPEQMKSESDNEESESEIYFEQTDSQSKKRKGGNRISHNSSIRNDTKNIPKNYGKAILTFIQKSSKTKSFINESDLGITFSDFMMQVRRIKKKVNSIESLRRMWGSDNMDHKIKKCIRILSYKFMRKHCLEYIFHSKVKNYGVHIKYRQKLIEGIENPSAFNNIKDF